MRKKLLCFLLCLLLVPIGIMGSAGGDGTTRCLLIGCDRFLSMPDTEPAGANNVETMGALLADFLPQDAVIRRYVNEPGSVEAFERMVETVFRDANDADTALIYLSTHGLLREDMQVELLLSDGENEERLEPEKLRQILDKVPGEKTLILDACHSGAIIGGGGSVNWFADSTCRVLTSSGALEDSWFWSAEADAYTGTGYFTSAMDFALRSSDPDQIDPNRDGKVSLEELTMRLRGIHGASTVYCWPESGDDSLFRLPENRKPRNRLRGLCFDPLLEMKEDGTRKLMWHFRTEESVRLTYHLVSSRNGEWDFSNTISKRDSGHDGLNWGVVSAGEFDRSITRTPEQFGNDGRLLLQIVSMKPDFSSPMVEGGMVMKLEDPVLPAEEETVPEGE